MLARCSPAAEPPSCPSPRRCARRGDDAFEIGGERLQALLDGAGQAIGFADVRALRAANVDDGAARIEFGEELYAMPLFAVQDYQADQQQDCKAKRGKAMFERGRQQSPVAVHKATRPVRFLARDEDRAEHRIDDQRDQQRRQQRDDQRDGQVLHEPAHDARPEDHGGEGGTVVSVEVMTGQATSPAPLMAAWMRRAAELVVAVDVLDHDDGVVDHHADGHDQAEQHDHVQRVAQQLQRGIGQQHCSSGFRGPRSATAASP